jgi:hypothetical protein
MIFFGIAFGIDRAYVIQGRMCDVAMRTARKWQRITELHLDPPLPCPAVRRLLRGLLRAGQKTKACIAASL